MSDKQVQKAGENSQQIQTKTLNITNNYVVGIDERRVREICSETQIEAMKSYSIEAGRIAEERIEKFVSDLIPRVEKIESDFHSFSDPAFQFQLIAAQKAAACTDRVSDYELLSDLLAHRICEKSNRKVAASISKAVEIVNQIDDDSLLGLTVVYLVSHTYRLPGNISEGFNHLDKIFSPFMKFKLPEGTEWLENLDVLNTIRIESFGSMAKVDDLYFGALDGYSCVGVLYESAEYQKAVEIFRSVALGDVFWVRHELLEGAFRIPVTKTQLIPNLRIKTVRSPVFPQVGQEQIKFLALSDEQIDAVKRVHELYSNDENLKRQVKQAFQEKWNSYPSLQKLKDWVLSISKPFTITQVGRVIAHANAQRYVKEIPSIY